MKYNPNFLEKEVQLPKLSAAQLKDTITNAEDNTLIEHLNYSVAMCKSRRLAWYSVARIDSSLKQTVGRDELWSSFRVENQLTKAQIIHKEWYRVSGELLDQGHLTPADVMEWGDSHEAAKENANDTFYFTNASPQHKKLNRNEWRLLEHFISLECQKTNHTRLLVITGNLLADDDPEYLPMSEPDFKLKIPIRFWKVIYYLNKKGKLCRIGFVMGQKELMEQSGLVAVQGLEKIHRSLDDAFTDLGKNKVFQVSVKQLAAWTGHKFSKAQEVLPETDMVPLGHDAYDLSSTKKEVLPEGIVLDGHLFVLHGVRI
jgi:endonuclease G, mitochondrial